MKYIKFIIMTVGVASLWSCISDENKDEKRIAKHVVVIGFDGLSPDGLRNANTPTFDKLITEGASTMQARAVLPTSSSPNWASMIMGAGPEQHGITSNSWEKNNFILPTVTQSEDFVFPTIFHVVDTQLENAEVGAIYHWTGFGRLFEKNAVDYDTSPGTEDETAEIASSYIKEKKPEFTFIHFDHVDHAGHEFGHGTPAYYTSVEKADALLAKVMESIRSSELANETVVIISADHGGLGKGHGGESLGEIEIPFVVWGKSVKRNKVLNFPVYQYDNAATVAFVLGLNPPKAWIGKPVKNAFEGYNTSDNFPTIKRLKEPVVFPKPYQSKKAGGLFDSVAIVVIENPNESGELHYTLNGEMPTKESKIYVNPFRVTKNTVVKSALFNKGKISSTVAEAFFRVKEENIEAPIRYEVFYLENLKGIPSLENRKPNSNGTSFEITSDEISEEIKNNTAIRFTTKITVEKESEYTFYLRSDDGSKLWIDDKVIVDNDGNHGIKERDGNIVLKPGTYKLKVVWFNGQGSGWLDVFYETTDIPKQILPTTIMNKK